MNQQEFNIQNDSDAENAESMTASDAENTAVTPDTSTAETKAGTFYEETETSKNEHYDTPEKPKRRLRSASNTARHKKKASHILLILFIILTAALLCCLIGTGLFLYRQNQTVQTLSLEVERYNSELEQKNAAQSELEAQISLLQETIAQSEAGKMNDLPEIPFSVDLNQWNYVLVNELNLLPQEYETTLKKVQNNQYVDERIVPDLEEMMKDAAKANCPLLICSSYRTYEKQEQLVKNSIRKYTRRGLTYKDAFFETKRTIALTGASEHHTGLAIDIVGKGHQSLDAAQANTKEAKWLYKNSYKYGFILRYPKDKTDITRIDFESWHFRYVGKEAAAFMYKNNLCLEEFLDLAALQQQKKENEKH